MPTREVSTVLRVEVPPSVKSHEPFAITVHTLSGGKTMPDRVEVRVTGLRAEIIPYDIIEQSSALRAGVAMDSPRSVSLQFDTPGIATIRVVDRESQVVVRPP